MFAPRCLPVCLGVLVFGAGLSLAQESTKKEVAPATIARPTTPELVRNPAEDKRPAADRLADIVDPVSIQGVAARRVFEWWGHTTRIPLVIDWDKLAKTGIDPDKIINLELRRVPAGQLLALVMKQLNTDTETLLYEISPWYIEVLTKSMANQRQVTRLYNIQDMLIEAPNYDPPTNFDLTSSLQSGQVSGRSGSSNRTGIFNSTTSVTTGNLRYKSPEEKGEEIAKLIRDTIEPGIWQENGGQYGSIKYFQGRLIVKAPLYVHAQIGLPEMTIKTDSGATSGAALGSSPNDSRVSPGNSASTTSGTPDRGQSAPISATSGRSQPVSSKER